jgi:crotonobetainyl-CoA:carnitine CoA-transferase CaiB-like acyl-CoA transferase
MNLPLDGILVIDFSQFLSGPSASLRLADFGARVIKVENPDGGDLCRNHYVSNVAMNGESSLFHAINRNKESIVLNLKKSKDLSTAKKIIQKADVVIHNFRPGVMERLGLDYKSVNAINSSIVYGEISGYGKEGPWKNMPGQDLLVQSLSGLTYLSGNNGAGPVPMGLAIVDILAGAHLVQGILACLVRKGITGLGGLVEVSMLESIIEFQFESITTFFMDGGQPTQRTRTNNAHAYLGAPYGVYDTKDGYLALAMGQIPVLGKLLKCDPLVGYQEESKWFESRDEIKSILGEHLKGRKTKYWLNILEPADIWCADVLTWSRLFDSEGFKILKIIQDVINSDGYQYKTTRCPIRFDDQILTSSKGSPILGEGTQKIFDELKID